MPDRENKVRSWLRQIFPVLLVVGLAVLAWAALTAGGGLPAFRKSVV